MGFAQRLPVELERQQDLIGYRFGQRQVFHIGLAVRRGRRIDPTIGAAGPDEPPRGPMPAARRTRFSRTPAHRTLATRRTGVLGLNGWPAHSWTATSSVLGMDSMSASVSSSGLSTSPPIDQTPGRHVHSRHIGETQNVPKLATSAGVISGIISGIISATGEPGRPPVMPGVSLADTNAGISKRGNTHLRSLLVHGARAVVRTAPNKTDHNNQWVNQLRQRRGFNRATVAVANKNARIIWAVLRTGEPYRAVF